MAKGFGAAVIRSKNGSYGVLGAREDLGLINSPGRKLRVRLYEAHPRCVATKTMVLVTDDLDPSLEATDTVRFALDNTQYEIDLSEKHSNELRSAVEKYVRRARTVGGQRGSRLAARQAPGRRTDLAQVRQWAAQNGVELRTRGRIASAVLAAYDAKDVKAMRAATGTPEPSARPARRSRARAGSVTAKAK
jgi:hypothetical protein